ncbi:protease Do-like 14 [Artemisia annua]|uniref:DNA-directed RNA polymerase n=1 Tax=Artemisia annua TaxID=35608 RepID=A0A2U1NI07_ARTAN|nr:protease Do-like 14 [Artemisia annua]
MMFLPSRLWSFIPSIAACRPSSSSIEHEVEKMRIGWWSGGGRRVAARRREAMGFDEMRTGIRNEEGRYIRPIDWVAAVGCPLSFQNTITAGIVSYVDRKRSDLGLEGMRREYLSTDCAINAVLTHHEVLAADGLSFSVPIDSASKIIEHFKTKGRVVRPWLGLKMLDLNDVIVARSRKKLFCSLMLPKGKGVLVLMYGITGNYHSNQVSPGSPTERACFCQRDVVVELEGKPVVRIKEDFLHLTSGKRKREDFPSEFGPDEYIPQQDGAGDAGQGSNSQLGKLERGSKLSLRIPQLDGPVTFPTMMHSLHLMANAVMIARDRKTAALLLQRLLYNIPPQSDTDLDRKPFNNDKPILFVFDIFFFVHLQTIYKISVGQIYLSKPMMSESDGETATLFPKAARLRNLTYPAPLYVDVTKRAIKKGHDHEETTETQDFGEVIHKNI